MTKRIQSSSLIPPSSFCHEASQPPGVQAAKKITFGKFSESIPHRHNTSQPLNSITFDNVQNNPRVIFVLISF